MTKIIPVSQLLNLSSKVALVTGGYEGIGLGITSRLAAAGAQVIVMGRDLVKAEASTAQLNAQGLKVKAMQGDVSVEADVQRVVADVISNFGQIDILVNNAGIFPNQPVAQMALADFQKVIAVNLQGVFLLSKYVSAEMIKKGAGGSIINITSIDALHPSMIGLAHYDASKHGVWGFTKNLALELAAHKIWVNAVAPGGIGTPGVAEMSSGGNQAAIDAFLATIPMHRMGEPDEIGKVVLFLASDMSSYMTGTQVVVDGGALLS